MNIYSGLLFLHGHIADTGLARQLTATPAAPQEPALGTPRANVAARTAPTRPSPTPIPGTCSR